jgi:methylenetetrahydrofolate--tRNA-(uracil-5-)-methyltransferase
MHVRARPGLFLAGQITGVEGYVESCASGFVCAAMLAQALRGLEVTPPPPTTALGGVITHVTRETPAYQPSNITWAWIPPLAAARPGPRLKKRERYEAMAERALADQAAWLATAPLARTTYLDAATISAIGSPMPPPTPSSARTVGATSESV